MVTDIAINFNIILLYLPQNIIIGLNLSFYGNFSKENLLIAHRGYREIAPENTLYAFRESLGRFDFLEIDIQLTKDNRWIIMHDETLERTTNIKKIFPNSNNIYKVNDYTLNEIKKLDATSWFLKDDPFKENKTFTLAPPTLIETLEFCKRNSMPINIEIKDMVNIEASYVTKLLIDDISTYLSSVNILISSFNHKYLTSLKEISNSLSTAINIEDNLPNNIIEYLSYLQVDALHIDKKLLKELAITELNNRGFTISAFTVNSRDEIVDIYNQGVRAIFSDIHITI